MPEVVADLLVKADWQGRAAEQGLSNLDKGIRNVVASAPRLSGLDRAVSGIGSSFSRLTAPISRVTSSVGGLVTGLGRVGLAGLGVTALTKTIGGLSNALFSGNADLEKNITTFKVFLGSEEKAIARMTELRAFSTATPFELPEITRASLALENLTKGVLSHGKGLEMIGNAASAVNQPYDELAITVGRVFAAFKAGGAGAGQEIQRLVELGVIAPETKRKLQELTESGASFDQMWVLIEKDMARFNGQMVEQSKTWSGLASTAKDNFGQIIITLTKPLFEEAKKGLAGVVDWLARPEVQANVNKTAIAIKDGVGKAVEFMSGAFNFAAPKVKAVFDWFTSSEVQSGIQTVAGWLLKGIAGAWEAIGKAAAWVWPNVLRPALDYFSQATVQKTIFDGIATAWGTLSDIGSAIWTNAIKPFGEWLSKPETQETLGAIASTIGGALAAGAKLAAENIELIVIAFAGWKIASLIIGVAELAATLMTKLVPALWATKAAGTGGVGIPGVGGSKGKSGGGGVPPIVGLGALAAAAGGLFMFEGMINPQTWEEEMAEVRAFQAELRAGEKLKISIEEDGLSDFEKKIHKPMKPIRVEFDWPNVDAAKQSVLSGFANLKIPIKLEVGEASKKAITEGFGSVRIPIEYQWPNIDAARRSVEEGFASVKIPVKLDFIVPTGAAASAVLGGFAGAAPGIALLKKMLPSQEEVGAEAKKVGSALDAGLVAGIAGFALAKKSSVTGAAAVIAATQAAFGQKSPSSIFAAIGALNMTGLAQGMIRGAQAVVGVARQVAAMTVGAVRAALNPSIFISLGVAVGAGLARGIAQSGGAAIAAARSVANAVTAATKAALAVKSPSAIFIEIGMNTMKGLSLGIKGGTPAAVQAVAEAAQAVIGAAQAGFDLLSKIGSGDTTLASSGQLSGFFSIFDVLVGQADAALGRNKKKFTEVKAKLAEFAGQIVGAFSSSVDVIAKLGSKDYTSPTQEVVTSFFGSLDRFVDSIDKRLVAWKGKFDEERAKLAGYVGDAVVGISRAIDPLAKLSDPEITFASSAGIDGFFTSLDLILPQISDRARQWYGLMNEGNAITAGYIGQAVDGVLKALDPIVKLGAPDNTFASQAAVSSFFDSLDLIAPEVSNRARQWYGLINQGVAEVAGYVGSAVNGILGAMTSLEKLAEPGLAMPLLGAVDKFFDALDLVAPKISDRSRQWFGLIHKGQAETAGYIGQAVSGVLSAVEPLMRLANPELRMPAVAAIDVFFDALDLVAPRISERARQWYGLMNEGMADVAKWIGSSVAEIGKAIEPLTKIAQIKELPTDEQVDAFFWKLEHFLNQFNKRGELWKGIATEITAKMGGWVGDIATGIGKALDPILKMADAQKITPGQIEGAMSNVWVALDQFNRVMSGGTNGTPFEGAWMDRARAFAESAGGIFTAIQAALGALGATSGGGDGGAGLSTLFASIRVQWASLFGDALTEGTILFMLFDHTVGFFAQLDQKTRVLLDVHKLLWLDKMTGIIEAIRLKFADMRTSLIPEANDTGYAIGEGIAAGITSSIPIIMEAAKKAVEDAITAAKVAAGITSPSKLAASEVGMPLALGVALGIDQGTSRAAQSMLRLVGQVAGVRGAAGRSISPGAIMGGHQNQNSGSPGSWYGDGNLIINGKVVLHDANLVKLLRDALYRQDSRDPGVEFAGA